MEIKLVECSEEHWEFVRLLRNDKRVLDGFIEDIYISHEMQQEYMNQYSNHYRIAIKLGKQVGYVGNIENDLRICTHPDFQSQGVAKFMLNEVTKIWPNAFGKIKINNINSLKLFESCGFSIKYYMLTKD